ncbi:MAG: DUF4440 domain-containing protein [Pseudomonadales bacterium]|nr:DUF4440 domain-containing protein [Pseudomonadales bacterium]
MNTLAQLIRQLEESLLHNDFSADPQLLDSLLAAEFEEIGPGGNKTSRQQVIEWLLHKPADARWRFTDFRIKPLAEDLVLALYHAQQADPQARVSKGSMRASVWKRVPGEAHAWQMLFHQATRVL